MRSVKGLPRALDWKALLGIALSAAFLYFALRDVNLGAVLREISRANPFLFLLSVAGATGVFVVRAWRWRLLLEPVRSGTTFRSRFAATTIGFMVNNVLPARIGEFVRAYALSRVEPVPVVASFASLVVERLFDGLTIVAFLFLTMALPGFPAGRGAGGAVGAAAAALLALVAVLIVTLVAMVVWPRQAVALFESAARILPQSFRRPIIDGLEAFLTGVGVLRRPSLLAGTFLWSAGLWLLNAFAFWLGFRAFDIAVPFSGALFLNSVVALAAALPSAPGFFGPYEAAVRVGLVDIWGVELNKALGFAIGFHMGGFVPVTLIGFYYTWRIGLSWRDVEASEEFVEEAVERRTPPAEEPRDEMRRP